jgi:hypothetical protein
MFYNPLRSDNIIHRPNHENSNLPPLTPLEKFRELLRIQRKKKKKKKKR